MEASKERNFTERFERIDTQVTEWMASNGILLLRISVGIVFFWFGILKFFPDLSPAEDLATQTIATLTFGTIQPGLSLPVLAAWEVLIGLGLITGKFMRATLLLLGLQMLGTITPLFLFPDQTWQVFPISPTLEGQYIIKNLVLVSAAIVIGATVRGGYLEADPPRNSEDH
ncbi:MAG: DoxX family protein [Anaerolineae bacterium]|nr:DoxX family protein [Anaerolineae bacterium]